MCVFCERGSVCVCVVCLCVWIIRGAWKKNTTRPYWYHTNNSEHVNIHTNSLFWNVLSSLNKGWRGWRPPQTHTRANKYQHTCPSSPTRLVSMGYWPNSPTRLVSTGYCCVCVCVCVLSLLWADFSALKKHRLYFKNFAPTNGQQKERMKGDTLPHAYTHTYTHLQNQYVYLHTHVHMYIPAQARRRG